MNVHNEMLFVDQTNGLQITPREGSLLLHNGARIEDAHGEGFRIRATRSERFVERGVVWDQTTILCDREPSINQSQAMQPMIDVGKVRR